jgi:hypothetical protein
MNKNTSCLKLYIEGKRNTSTEYIKCIDLTSYTSTLSIAGGWLRSEGALPE